MSCSSSKNLTETNIYSPVSLFCNVMSEQRIELKSIESMPGSINELVSINKNLRRPPSLSESFAWTPENIYRANTIPLISSSEQINLIEEDLTKKQPNKCEQKCIKISIKLLFHITLISIFETLQYYSEIKVRDDKLLYDLLIHMIAFDPDKRYNGVQCLGHSYFHRQK